MGELVEVKYFEPAKNCYGIEPKLDGLLSHPARYTYCNCLIDKGKSKKESIIRMVGGQGSFTFVNNKCSNFLGHFEAEIVQEISRDRLMEEDRYELVVD